MAVIGDTLSLGNGFAGWSLCQADKNEKDVGKVDEVIAGSCCLVIDTCIARNSRCPVGWVVG